MTYQSVNPFDNKLARSFDDITDAQLEAKIAAAAMCYEAWKRTSYAERALVMARAAALLHDHAERFARVMTLEMGCAAKRFIVVDAVADKKLVRTLAAEAPA